MNVHEKIKQAQQLLQQQKIDGWLLYDFRRSNDLTCSFLEIPQDKMLTRRFFYWLPSQGEPLKIVSAIEAKTLEHLPGKTLPYKTWTELEAALKHTLKSGSTIAMEYSPRNAVPYVSKVDAGTIEMVRELGVHVVTSADLLQHYTSVWDQEKIESHLAAAKIVSEIVASAWAFITDKLKRKVSITEYDVQQFIIAAFKNNNCVHEGDPICAVNEHSADPHYAPSKERSAAIKEGDFILIDLWCKLNQPRATYADITRVGIVSTKPTPKQQKIFDIVKSARDAGTRLVQERFALSQPVMGWEIDQVCRDVIENAGYGEYFIHRTGHNIDISDHGSGAHIDNYETQDRRTILCGTCFSIEPGIYLPGEFGVRLEYDVLIHPNATVEVTGGIQNEIACIYIS